MRPNLRRSFIALSVPVLAAAAVPTAGAATPTSSAFGGYPTVGALFSNVSGTGVHGCTASVVASTTHDTIITAAHCVSGAANTRSFAPEYRAGAKPFGTWQATRTYIDPRWKSGQNPLYDVAVLTLAKHYINGRWQGVQDIVGGANVLHSAPVAGSSVEVPAYNSGSGDYPIHCTSSVYYTGSYPGFNCSNYRGGVSGSPFLQTIGSTRYVTGVIGGLHQGGCSYSTSYSAPFGAAEQTLLARAESNAPSDYVPAHGGDGC